MTYLGPVGRVTAVNISRGGVPKLPVDWGYVTVDGLEGDGHRDRVHHGGPLRALCLFSTEVIAALRAEGHPIFAGAAGENLTFSGVDWIHVTPGTRWSIGAEVEIEITSYTAPCNNNASWFLEGRFSRMRQSLHPGFARVYARVVSEGPVVPGDQFSRVE